MVITFGSLSLLSSSILTLMDFIESSKGKMNDYNEEQSQAQNKDYFKDKFIGQ